MDNYDGLPEAASRNAKQWMSAQSETMYKSWGKMWSDSRGYNKPPKEVFAPDIIPPAPPLPSNGKLHCQSCGQWGEHQSTCGHCGSPTE